MPLHRQWPAFEPIVSTARFVGVERHRDVAARQDELLGEPSLEVDRLATRGGRRGRSRPGRGPVARSAAWHRRRSPGPRPARSGSSASAPVGPADGVARVLPALVEQTGRGASLVFDEAVAVAIAPVVDPGQGARGRSATAGRRARRRRSSRGSRRAGPARAASSRWSRSTGENGSSPVRVISPVRNSCRILPGSASRHASTSVAWWAARISSVSIARRGAKATLWSDVMSESRPNSVANHGTPADDERLAVGGRRAEQAQVVHRTSQDVVDDLVVRLDRDGLGMPGRVDRLGIGDARDGVVGRPGAVLAGRGDVPGDDHLLARRQRRAPASR